MDIYTIAGELHQRLVDAGIPIDGVSLGNFDDRATWRINYSAEPTVEQKAVAQAVIDAFDTKALTKAELALEGAKQAAKDARDRMTKNKDLADINARLLAIEMVLGLAN
jgi:hypothetical protein